MKYLVIYGGAGVIGLFCAMVISPTHFWLGAATSAVLGGAWGWAANRVMGGRKDD